VTVSRSAFDEDLRDAGADGGSSVTNGELGPSSQCISSSGRSLFRTGFVGLLIMLSPRSRSDCALKMGEGEGLELIAEGDNRVRGMIGHWRRMTAQLPG
jgi:hypothetical protein